MAQVLLAAGGLIFLVLGAAHGALTLRDLIHPRAFTPTDDNLRRAMQASAVAFSPRLNLWKAWLGFNLSHSLGVAIFGGGLTALGWLHFPFFAQSALLQLAAVAVAAAYLLLSLRFWFRGPAIGTGAGLACLLLSALLLHAG